MHKILYNDLDYSGAWMVLAELCGVVIPTLQATIEEARMRSGGLPDAKGNRIIEVTMGQFNISTVYHGLTKKVLAQIETELQDGCCPPVHRIMARTIKQQTTHHDN